MALAVDADINQLDSLTFIVLEICLKQEYNRKEDSFEYMKSVSC